MVSTRSTKTKPVSKSTLALLAPNLIAYAPEGWADCVLEPFSNVSHELSKTNKADMSQSPSCYTIYFTQNGIELYEGCDDFQNYQVISTCVSYESALEVARVSARLKNVPLIDRTYEKPPQDLR